MVRGREGEADEDRSSNHSRGKGNGRSPCEDSSDEQKSSRVAHYSVRIYQRPEPLNRISGVSYTVMISSHRPAAGRLPAGQLHRRCKDYGRLVQSKDLKEDKYVPIGTVCMYMNKKFECAGATKKDAGSGVFVYENIWHDLEWITSVVDAELGYHLAHRKKAWVAENVAAQDEYIDDAYSGFGCHQMSGSRLSKWTRRPSIRDLQKAPARSGRSVNTI